jgi:anti-sigma factor RsiW
MNPSPYDHPDLTAYALGELNSVESARVRQWLAQSPEARAEYEMISQTLNALREQAPPIPQRTLNPRQRETILAMGQLRASHNPGRDQARRIAWGVAKLAAAASITAGAFALGMKFSDRLQDVAKSSAEPFPATQNASNSGNSPTDTTRQVATAEKEAGPAQTPAPRAPEIVPSVKVVAEATSDGSSLVLVPASGAPVAAAGSAAAAEEKHEVAPQAPVTAAPKPVPAASLKAFAVAKAQPETFFVFHPKLLRPKIQSTEFAGLTVAAPVPDRVKNAPKNAPPRKPEAQPPLVLHSLDAKISSCPWDSSRRLMRVVAQIPVEQAAVDANDQDYHLNVKFDPAQVQGYRLIMEKHMAASSTNKLATRFAWYEVIPAKSYVVSHDRPVVLGVMEVAQPRGTPAGFGGPARKLVDRGSDWSEMGEAYVFETAMVGFNLLLQGSENVGSLNHRLVLDLAQQSKGDDPNEGERSKFIHAVQQAQKAAGL